ncbi:hypothetical protein N7532_008849 [Penicillium argentinense]|uniref:Protoporphyrinogen oxidase n=1 Tax=Penicillium argentinense TaxID=1131581 RepID=A0A9W9K2A4_9EURO|nr:uncharacterized protein N7532_008849 [Penicillium argentinense]KAJ5090165.1 hypothetical protein N7532_008849 [Penicillium argentinense]
MPLPCIPNGLRLGQRPLATVIRGQRRAYHAAVVGGGITGLTAAWKLARDPKCTQVTLYEKSTRLGGWMESEKIPVDGGHVVFEYGPRTLRWSIPTSGFMLEMAVLLGIADQMIFTQKNSPAALNRYIYYPDHLVRLPSPRPDIGLMENLRNFFRAFKEPVMKPLLPALLFEHTKPTRVPDEWQKDESVSSFISRRFNSQVADNLVSAVFHGIYAGDIDQLSAQMLLGSMRDLEYNGVLYGMFMKAFSRRATLLHDDMLAQESSNFSAGIQEMVDNDDVEGLRPFKGSVPLTRGASTFTFKCGTQQLTDAIASTLEKSNKVEIRTGVDIRTISYQPNEYKPMDIATSNDRKSYDHVIAAIPAPALKKVLEETPPSTNHPVSAKSPSHRLPSDTIQQLKPFDYATTVMVVNLYYSNPSLLPEQGFGYLIPRSVPADQNPECGLGVIFASNSSEGLGEADATMEHASDFMHKPCPTMAKQVSQDTVRGTKLTVMMGGHYWDHFKPSDYPDHDTAVSMARNMLERHLGITDVPAITRSRLQKNAIPQYKVGHLDRVYELSKAVKRDFNQRLVLAGNWYNGVGVGDCVRQGIMAATYGIGYKIPPQNWKSPTNPWASFNQEDWDLQGGIPTAPVRMFEAQVRK